MTTMKAPPPSGPPAAGSHGVEILDDTTCWELLAATPVGRLAVSIAGRPDVFPVNHVVDRRTLVMRTAEGTKLTAAVLGTAVAYEIDGWSPAHREVWSVVVKGSAHEVEGLCELLDALELPVYPWVSSTAHRVVRIHPEEVSGRRFHAVTTPG